MGKGKDNFPKSLEAISASKHRTQSYFYSRVAKNRLGMSNVRPGNYDRIQKTNWCFSAPLQDDYLYLVGGSTATRLKEAISLFIKWPPGTSRDTMADAILYYVVPLVRVPVFRCGVTNGYLLELVGFGICW
jgi:hypothetical protein